MKVGAKFWLGRSVPKAAALQTSTKTSNESVRAVPRTDRREDHPLHQARERRARLGIESRLPPEHSERKEGDDEHRRASEEKEPPGYREVADSAEAVSRGRRRSDERGEYTRPAMRALARSFTSCALSSANPQRGAARTTAVPRRIGGPHAEAQRGTGQHRKRHSPR